MCRPGRCGSGRTKKTGSDQHSRLIMWLIELLFFLGDGVLHSLAGFESGGLCSLDLDDLAGAGVPAVAGGALTGLKSTKAGQDHFAVGNNTGNDSVQRGGNDLLSFCLGNSSILGYDFNEFSFVHILFSFPGLCPAFVTLYHTCAFKSIQLEGFPVCFFQKNRFIPPFSTLSAHA